jgi:hypothetical protein
VTLALLRTASSAAGFLVKESFYAEAPSLGCSNGFGPELEAPSPWAECVSMSRATRLGLVVSLSKINRSWTDVNRTNVMLSLGRLRGRLEQQSCRASRIDNGSRSVRHHHVPGTRLIGSRSRLSSWSLQLGYAV